MGIECFSHGAYLDPKGHKSLPRPEIVGMKYNPDLEKLAREHPKTQLPQELIDWADIIMIAHTPEWVTENWDRIKHKKVVWRSIGQSTKHVENSIRRMRYEGLLIVRMSPMEQHIPDYIGADAIIRFYKEPKEFGNWNGETKRVINFTQSLKGRRVFCHYDSIFRSIEGFPATIYGTGNDDLGPLNGGELPYDLMKGALRDNRVFIYGGTWPSPYTLAFIEAWMSGIPIVAIGNSLAGEMPEIPHPDRINYYEIPALIENGINGFFSDDLGQIRAWIHELLENPELAKMISKNGHDKAVTIFGRDAIETQWAEFFANL